jgi:hypothetical protein
MVTAIAVGILILAWGTWIIRSIWKDSQAPDRIYDRAVCTCEPGELKWKHDPGCPIHGSW